MPRVLVVEDDPVIRELVAFKLAQGGFEVDTAEDGEAGLDSALAQPPDLVLLDVMMPRLSGIEVCRRLRAEPQTASLPVIMLSANIEEAEVERGFAAGADDYMAKPFSPRELVRRVEVLLNRTDSQPPH